MRVITSLLVVVATAALVCQQTAAKEPKPFTPGRATARTTKGGVQYAVFVPKGWKKKKALPLIMHIPMERFSPADALLMAGEQHQFCELQASLEPPVLICTPLLEAHNKESANQKKTPNLQRFQELLDRDAEAVVAVIDDLAKQIPVRTDRVILSGYRLTADSAMGIASRRPGRFAGVVLKDVRSITWAVAGEFETWGSAPKAKAGEPLRKLPIVLCYDGSDEGAASNEAYHEKIRTWLTGIGIRRVEIIGTKEWSYGKWVVTESFDRLYALLDEEEARGKKRRERDEVLAEARRLCETGKLPAALRTYAKALAFERKHSLQTAGKTVYGLLEAEGRKLLAEADGLPLSKRRSQYRKVLRLFKGTPLEEEVRAALKGM